MDPLDLALRILLLGLSLILLAVSARAWRRAGGRRMAWVMLSFLGFASLSVLTLVGTMTGDEAYLLPNPVIVLLLAIIGANYLALLKG